MRPQPWTSPSLPITSSKQDLLREIWIYARFTEFTVILISNVCREICRPSCFSRELLVPTSLLIIHGPLMAPPPAIFWPSKTLCNSSCYLLINNLVDKPTRCPKKSTYRMLLEPRCKVSITRSQHPLLLYFGTAYNRLKSIKCSIDISTCATKNDKVISKGTQLYCGQYSYVSTTIE